MARVQSNIITNLCSAVVTTVMTAAITPVQVNLLGIEAYGIIGFIATLQIIFSAFDLGLSSTLTREIAAEDRSNGGRRTEALIRSASTIYWAVAALLAIMLSLLAGPIANRWFTAGEIDAKSLQDALYLVIIYLALRWPVALYTGVLSGLQRIDIVNYVKIGTTTLRNMGGIVVILIWRDLQIFFWWLAVNALLEVVVFFIAARRAYPGDAFRFGMSLEALRSVWRFSLSMSAISILALLISQFDRIVTSKLLPLDGFGYYSLAYNTAAIAAIATTAVSSAMLPSFAASQRDHGALICLYMDASRVVLFLMGMVSFSLVFFGDTVLHIWIGPRAAAEASVTLALLATGFWFSAAFSNPYNMTVALGRPWLTLQISMISALPYAAVLIFLTLKMGGIGAALSWVLLTFAYLLALVPIVHRRLLNLPVMPWVLGTLLPFGSLGLMAFGIPRLLLVFADSSNPSLLGQLVALSVASVLYVAMGYRLLGARIQQQLVELSAIPIRLWRRRFENSR